MGVAVAFPITAYWVGSSEQRKNVQNCHWKWVKGNTYYNSYKIKQF